MADAKKCMVIRGAAEEDLVRAVEEEKPSTSPPYSSEVRIVELHLHFSIRLHGVVLN
jgi:hypothetical protein